MSGSGRGPSACVVALASRARRSCGTVTCSTGVVPPPDSELEDEECDRGQEGDRDRPRRPRPAGWSSSSSAVRWRARAERSAAAWSAGVRGGRIRRIGADIRVRRRRGSRSGLGRAVAEHRLVAPAAAPEPLRAAAPAGTGSRGGPTAAAASVASRASAMAAADGHRSFGSSASALRVIAARSGGTDGRTVAGSGIGPRQPGERDRCRAVALPRPDAGEHLVQDDAQAVDVRGRSSPARRGPAPG